MHGKTSSIRHDGRGIFAGIDGAFDAVRYHSLIGERASFPEGELEITAWLESGMIMGVRSREVHAQLQRRSLAGRPAASQVRHRKYTVEGVQFHPESILTEHGHKMLRNFLDMRGGEW